jgi:hypothetical protein
LEQPTLDRLEKDSVSTASRFFARVLIAIGALKIPMGAHPGDSGWLWIFRALFFIYLGIKPRRCCQFNGSCLVLFSKALRNHENK